METQIDKNNLDYVLNNDKGDIGFHGCGHYRFSAGIYVWFSDIHPYKTKEEALRMVKLIAAAPELLEALICLEKANSNDGTWDYAAAMDKARRAINKATNIEK